MTLNRNRPRRIPFIKLQSLGNHFILIDARSRPISVSKAAIVHLCAHRFGIGGDQLIVLESSEHAAASMRIYNVDGFEAEACGNAARCVADYLMLSLGTDSVNLDTKGGLIRGARRSDGAVRVDLRSPEFLPQQSTIAQIAWGPFSRGVGVFVGNPHVIFFSDCLGLTDLCEWAPSIQADACFPESVNVTLAKILGPNHLSIATFERSVGLTKACGTGALASVFASAKTVSAEQAFDLKQPTRVYMPGGAVEVQQLEERMYSLTGPVATAFRGELPWTSDRIL